MTPSPDPRPSSGRSTFSRSAAAVVLTDAALLVHRAAPGSDDVGVTMLLRDGAVHGHATAFAREVDEVQHAFGEGPCIDAATAGDLVRTNDLALDERRWPRFAPTAAELGLRSAVSLPLHGHGRVIGALNLYSRSAQRLREVAEADLRRLGDRIGPTVQNTWLLTVAVGNSARLRAAARRQPDADHPPTGSTASSMLATDPVGRRGAG